MLLTTTLNIGEKFWRMSDNCPKEFTVVGILIKITDVERANKPKIHIFYQGQCDKPTLDTVEIMESQIFQTKRELLDSL